ncbi:hypothetical protein L195_g061025, partial [Trifolium pratense]
MSAGVKVQNALGVEDSVTSLRIARTQSLVSTAMRRVTLVPIVRNQRRVGERFLLWMVVMQGRNRWWKCNLGVGKQDEKFLSEVVF